MRLKSKLKGKKMHVHFGVQHAYSHRPPGPPRLDAYYYSYFVAVAIAVTAIGRAWWPYVQ
jgi:hypothetical protein